MTLKDWERWVEDEDFIIPDSPAQETCFQIKNQKVLCDVCHFGLNPSVFHRRKKVVPDYALIGATPKSKQAMETHIGCEWHKESLPDFLGNSSSGQSSLMQIVSKPASLVQPYYVYSPSFLQTSPFSKSCSLEQKSSMQIVSKSASQVQSFYGFSPSFVQTPPFHPVTTPGIQIPPSIPPIFFQSPSQSLSPTKTPHTTQEKARIQFPQLSKIKTRSSSKSSSPSSPTSSSSFQSEKEEQFLDAVGKRVLMIHHTIRNKQSINSVSDLQDLFDKVVGETLTSDLAHKSPFSTREFIMALKEAVKERLKKRLKKYRYYSIIIDDSKDKGGIIELCVYIRIYGRNKQAESSFLSFCQLDERGSPSDVLFDLLDGVLLDWELDPHDMIALTSDGASNMSGYLSGVYARLRQKYKVKRLIFVHCAAHRCNLLAEALLTYSSVSPSFSENLAVISNVAHIFHSSPKQKDELKIVVKNFGAKPIAIPIECDTRWLSRFQRFAALF
jgi:hypothetical protein